MSINTTHDDFDKRSLASNHRSSPKGGDELHDKKSSDRIEVREAGLRDVSRLIEVYRDAYSEVVNLGYRSQAADADRQMVESWVRSSQVYVAILDETIVGTVRLSIDDSNRTVLGRFAVATAYRKRGIGSRLLTDAETRACTDGNAIIRLYTYAGHPYLPTMYQRRGYRIIEVNSKENRSYDTLTMEKECRRL